MNLWKLSGVICVTACITACKKEETIKESSWNEDAEARLDQRDAETPVASEFTEENNELYTEESFEIDDRGYQEGGLLGQNAEVMGFKGPWLTNNKDSMIVSSAGLEYPGIRSSGGKIETPRDQSRFRNGRRLDVGYDDTSSEVVYISFLFQIEDIGDVKEYRAFELHDSRLGNLSNGFDDAINRKFALGVYVPDFGTKGFGFRINEDSTLLGELSTMRDTDVNLFVLKFELSDDSMSDSVTVWLNPSLNLDENVNEGVTVSGFDISFDTISLARFGGTGTYLDEIRMGDSYSSVTPMK